MVKPLNKEWELFGSKYRVAGAKGDKVNCNACQKQVSAAVNRLQSHLRVCLARPALAAAMGENADALLKQQLKQQQSHPDEFEGECAGLPHALTVEDHRHADPISDSAELTDAALDANGGAAFSAASQVFLSTDSAPQAAAAAEPEAGVPTSAVPAGNTHPTAPAAGTAASAAVVPGTTPSTDAPPAKRHKTLPIRTNERPRWSNGTASASSSSAATAAMDDFWLSGTPQQSSSSAYAKRRLELEEKRLLLEMKKGEREERRELYHLEILEAQARKERLVAEKAAYEGKVLLALSRKQLRDQGVSEDEIDRILPVGSNTVAAASVPAATAKSYATPAVDDQC